MALFYYEAFSKEGKKISGTLDATTIASVTDQLTKMGAYPIKIESAREEKRVGLSRILGFFSRGVSVKDKILFTKQLSVLLKSGVPLLQSLELLIDQFTGKLKTMIIEMRDAIKEGQSLAVAMARYPKVFDTTYVQLVRAGEATGKLEMILDRLTDYMERRQEITKRVKSALRYPMIQLGFIGVIVIALMIFVVPNLAQTFKRQGAELPAATKLLMATSDFIRSYYILIFIGIVALYLLFRYIKSTARGARIIDTIKLNVPIVRFFARMGAVVQFSRTLGMLTEGGVNLSEALDIVVKIVDNRVLADSLQQARDKIIKEGRIAEYLKQSGVFPPIATYLIKTGEDSGQLDTMLLTVAKNYEDDLAEYADALSSALEPIMLVVMAVIVGFIVLAVATPIMQQSQLAGA